MQFAATAATEATATLLLLYVVNIHIRVFMCVCGIQKKTYVK